MLFKPFSLKKWMKLLFIAWLAGALGSSSGNFNIGDFNGAEDAEAYPVREENIYQQKGAALSETLEQMPSFSSEDIVEESIGSEEEMVVFPHEVEGSLGEEAERSQGPSFKEIVIVGALGSLIVLPFMLLMTWISARFKFIWYDAIVRNEARIGDAFSQYQKEGNSLFILYLYYGFLWLAFLIGVGLWTYLGAKAAGAFEEAFVWSFGSFMQLFGLQILLFVLMIFAALIVVFVIDHFLVPIMAMDRVAFSEGFAKLGAVYKSRAKDLWMFLLLNVGLSMLCGIISLIAVVMILLIFALAGLLVFGLLYLLTVVALKAKIIFAIFAVVLGIPFAVVTLLTLITTALPFAVFFRHLSLYMLSSLSCGYTPLPLEEPPSADPTFV